MCDLAKRHGAIVEGPDGFEGGLEVVRGDMPRFLDAVPLDPFDGKPLRYRELGTGFVVYSIGPNRRDDGGKEWKTGVGFGADYDVTFVVER